MNDEKADELVRLVSKASTATLQVAAMLQGMACALGAMDGTTCEIDPSAMAAALDDAADTLRKSGADLARIRQISGGR